MPVIQTDRRSRTFESAPELLEHARDVARERREKSIELARTLLRIQRSKAQFEEACGTITMFGRRLGLTAFETVRLVRLAEAMEAEDSVEERVRSGKLSIPAAAALAPVLPTMDLLIDGVKEDATEWLDEAETAPYADTRRRARRRMAEIRCGELVDRVEVMVPDSVVERFERARALASRKAKRQLSRDETFEVVVDAYVDANDPLEVEERARRVDTTCGHTHSTYKPIRVRREVRRRAADQCEYPGCRERVHLEFAHRRPHWAGGCREAHNLFLLCRYHHVLLDARWIVPVGPIENPVWFQGPVFVSTRDAPEAREPQTPRELRIAAAIQRMQEKGAYRKLVDAMTGRNRTKPLPENPICLDANLEDWEFHYQRHERGEVE